MVDDFNIPFSPIYHPDQKKIKKLLHRSNGTTCICRIFYPTDTEYNSA
jgi:hypothetical protein